MMELVCPNDRSALTNLSDNQLCCERGHRYAVINGIPVLLPSDEAHTHGAWLATLKAKPDDAPWFVETLGLTPEQRSSLRSQLALQKELTVDPAVSWLIESTSGALYRPLIGRLPRYPIPELRLPPGNGRTLVDIGCNWGRWSIAAARLGYRVIGIDPSIGHIAAARRVAEQLGVDCTFVVADGRHLPVPAGSLDTVFSFGVLQHFSKPNVLQTLSEAATVLKPGGTCFIQMASATGIRSLYQQIRRGFREPRGFEVRYWNPHEIKREFQNSIGPSELSVDCYFGLGIQPADIDLLPGMYRNIVRASEFLRAISMRLQFLKYVADSLYVSSIRR